MEQRYLIGENTLNTWISLIDDYQQVDETGKKTGKDLSTIDLLLPPNSKARKTLNEGTHQGKTSARKKFLEHLYNNIFILENNYAPNAEPIEITKFLDRKGLELYQEAIKEESNSKKFREAVFVNSTNHYEGAKWKKRMVLWVGGPSAAGKTFCLPEMIKRINETMPKDTSRVKFSSEDGGPATNEKDDSGNDVVSVDGGIQREISQMRQMLLQVALAKGYTGIHKLDDGQKLDTKNHVKRAAEATNSLSMVMPDTFVSSFYTPTKRFPQDKRIQKFKKFERDENTEQYFSVVDCEPGKKAEFKEGVFHSGPSRSWYDQSGENRFKPSQVKMNNTNIGCESKAYAWNFDKGVECSKYYKEEFESISQNPDNHVLTFITDLVHIYQNPNNEFNWEICPLEEVPSHKMSKRDFHNFKIFQNAVMWDRKGEAYQAVSEKFKDQRRSEVDPNDFLKACREQGINAKPIIRTKAEMRQFTPISRKASLEEARKSRQIKRSKSFAGRPSKKQDGRVIKRISSDINRYIEPKSAEYRKLRQQGANAQESSKAKSITTQASQKATESATSSEVIHEELFGIQRKNTQNPSPAPSTSQSTSDQTQLRARTVVSRGTQTVPRSIEHQQDDASIRDAASTTHSLPRDTLTKQRDLQDSVRTQIPATKPYLAIIVDKANEIKQQADGRVKDVKTFSEGTQITKAVITYKGLEADKDIKVNVEAKSHDQVQFSVKKSASADEKNLAIIESCKLGVKVADKDTIFTVPASLDDQKQRLVIETLDAEIQQAIKQGVFSKAECPKIQSSRATPIQHRNL